jgi:hypothetical protein
MALSGREQQGCRSGPPLPSSKTACCERSALAGCTGYPRVARPLKFNSPAASFVTSLDSHPVALQILATMFPTHDGSRSLASMVELFASGRQAVGPALIGQAHNDPVRGAFAHGQASAKQRHAAHSFQAQSVWRVEEGLAAFPPDNRCCAAWERADRLYRVESAAKVEGERQHPSDS